MTFIQEQLEREKKAGKKVGGWILRLWALYVGVIAILLGLGIVVAGSWWGLTLVALGVYVLGRANKTQVSDE